MTLIGETSAQLKVGWISGLSGDDKDLFDINTVAKLLPDLMPVRLEQVGDKWIRSQLGGKHKPTGSYFMGVRFATPTKLYGMFCLWREAKIGAFTEGDEEIAGMAAELGAIAYESFLQGEALQESDLQIRLLKIRESEREQERHRISLAIHDDLGQDLTAIKMELQLLARRPPEERSDLISRLKAVGSNVDDVIGHVRQIATDLRLPVLDLGLTPAIRAHANRFEARTGIRCDVEADEIVNLDLPRAITVFRIFQESLTNVARHAQAATVKVLLRLTSENLILRVQDDGRGLAQNPPGSSSLGILGMRERAAQFNGSLTIESRPQRGTTVLMMLPVI